jgi:hypothetical protein
MITMLMIATHHMYHIHFWDYFFVHTFSLSNLVHHVTHTHLTPLKLAAPWLHQIHAQQDHAKPMPLM